MRNWATIAAGILLAALLIFVVISNSDEVTVVLPLIQWRTKRWAGRSWVPPRRWCWWRGRCYG